MATIITVIVGGTTAAEFVAGNTESRVQDRRDLGIAAVFCFFHWQRLADSACQNLPEMCRSRHVKVR
jgi:hypothetical protein